MIVINSFLTILAKVVIEIVIILINISYHILFKTFFFKINIKKIINNLYIVFFSLFI